MSTKRLGRNTRKGKPKDFLFYIEFRLTDSYNESMNQRAKFTYLIHDGRLYKIGQSDKPEQRTRDFLTANPFCELLAYSDKVTERELHQKYARQRKGGEWFELSQNDVGYILAVMDGREKLVEIVFDIPVKKIDIPPRDNHGAIYWVPTERAMKFDAELGF